VATYRFQYLSAKNGWQNIGEEPASRESSAREAFSRLSTSQGLSAGEYRFKRSDESPSHHWGRLTLTEDGAIVPGNR
jgi:hypothetical protein